MSGWYIWVEKKMSDFLRIAHLHITNSSCKFRKYLGMTFQLCSFTNTGTYTDIWAIKTASKITRAVNSSLVIAGRTVRVCLDAVVSPWCVCKNTQNVVNCFTSSGSTATQVVRNYLQNKTVCGNLWYIGHECMWHKCNAKVAFPAWALSWWFIPELKLIINWLMSTIGSIL